MNNSQKKLTKDLHKSLADFEITFDEDSELWFLYKKLKTRNIIVVFELETEQMFNSYLGWNIKKEIPVASQEHFSYTIQHPKFFSTREHILHIDNYFEREPHSYSLKNKKDELLERMHFQIEAISKNCECPN